MCSIQIMTFLFSYTVSKYVSVVMITVGIILATVVSAREAVSVALR